ncbi:FMN-linked oxidoreductase [Pholiota conissans]|uniref:FMN-linked oxidoreductase n=1 Tax=Pholiota conissans TaxID=109636 RepID=A0A9P5ZAH2_9AGAR|nr:FMN-linked oxidoreductase [Pholiota conissans]
MSSSPEQSKLFTPATFGAFELKHRVVLAPLTRNRGTQSQKYERTWFPDNLNVEYYSKCATEGGLLITEATPISLQSSGLPGVPGIFTDEQVVGWKKVVDAVHAKGGVFVMQLWHQGRNTHSCVTGMQTLSASAVSITESQYSWNGVPSVDWEVPKAMTQEDIDMVKKEYVDAAKAAREAGFDGIEIHGANGYLPDQFLHSNTNLRTDSYGGSSENRCRFLLELASELGNAIGFDRVGVRLSPFGFFNQTRGKDRLYQWAYLCRQLSRLDVAYVHLIEPRFDEARSEQEKLRDLTSSDSEQELPGLAADQLTSHPFREALGRTPCIVAGGYNFSNCWEGIERGDHDAIAFGRYFTSNLDLVIKLRTGKSFVRYDRSRFYGPFPDNAAGYTSNFPQEIASPDDAPQTSHGK